MSWQELCMAACLSDSKSTLGWDKPGLNTEEVVLCVWATSSAEEPKPLVMSYSWYSNLIYTKFLVIHFPLTKKKKIDVYIMLDMEKKMRAKFSIFLPPIPAYLSTFTHFIPVAGKYTTMTWWLLYIYCRLSQWWTATPGTQGKKMTA